MSRKRSHAFLETGQVPEAPSDGAEEEAGGFPELDTDEELVCSVSDITEHLGRNMTALLEAALAEIRKLVGVRIRVLKMELREKNEEVALLRARLQVAERDVGAVARELVVPELERRSEQKKGKTGVPVVKKEKINAICDYLMKDKNSRSCGAEVDGEQLSPSPAEWTDSGVTGGGGAGGAGGEPGTDAGADDLFSILPSSSKRLYDYEWMTGVELNSDFKGEHEAKCESITVAPEADEEDDDSEGGRGGLGLVSDEPSGSFSLDAHASSGEDGSPVGDGMDRLDPGQHFSSHTFICPFCGTLCPDSSYLEEHIKLMHRDESIQAMQSTSSGSRGEGAEGNRGRVAGGSGPRERKVKGGYECVECGRHFNYLGNLRQHQRIHTGEKPFVCPECGERFRHAARLKSHKLSHSGAQSPFPCPQCGKGFSVLSGLKRHQRVHTGESPYGCPQCGRRFKELGNLYTHMRIHSGATPYACYQCGRSFRHLGTFKSHRCTPATQLASGHAPAWVQDDKVHTG